MRELLAYTLRSLGLLLRVTSLFAVLVGIGVPSYCLPLPIGQLSDYGNVLDHNGRERITSLIEQVHNRFGLNVYILASWENSGDDILRYAATLLDAWNLARGRTLLAVFLRTGRDWKLSVLSGAQTTATYPHLAREVEDGITDLVEHRRIEEAMVMLFEVLERQASPVVTQVAPSPEQAATSGKGRRVIPALLLLACLGVIGLLIHRRICPRCGRILRIRESRAFGPYRRRNVIYYCQRCGYSRTKRGED